jgi:putative FmdB family regulatory protein
MPTYEYACKKCGEHLEVVQSFRDDPLKKCPQCAGELRKVFGAIGITFKGSGFYKTDSRPRPKDGASSESKSSSSDSKGSSGSSDSKGSDSKGSDSKGSSGSSGKGSDSKSSDSKGSDSKSSDSKGSSGKGSSGSSGAKAAAS